MSEGFALLPDGVVRCLRCGEFCRQGTPDPKARAIVHTDKGFCPNCMITKFLLSIEVLRSQIEGTSKREGLGPEIFFNSEWMNTTFRPIMARILAHTQMREASINWIEVVGNWGLPWPKGHEPHENANY